MAAVRVTLNGEWLITSSSSVQSLLEETKLLDKRIAVELNREVISRSCYADTRLNDGDVIEIVQFVGGG